MARMLLEKVEAGGWHGSWKSDSYCDAMTFRNTQSMAPPRRHLLVLFRVRMLVIVHPIFSHSAEKKLASLFGLTRISGKDWLPHHF